MSGFQATREQALAPGVEIDSYTISRVLGIGGFGVTYQADDESLQRKVAIKEYFPGSLAVRAEDGRTISARADDGDDFFDYGLRRFLDEARTLAQFHHPNIVHVNRYIEANGTAYLIMDYEEGQSLEALLRGRRWLDVLEIQPMLSSVLMGLKSVHDQSYLHRDIKPDNIFLRNDGPPLLLDFGSARQALENQRQSMTVVLTPGYAPIEQYAQEEQQGPYSDIYSVGATVFRCLVGRHPPESTARISAIHNGSEDPAVRQLRGERPDVDPAFLSVVAWMIEPRARERPQSAMEVLGALDKIDTQNLRHTAVTEMPSRAAVEPVAHVPTVELRETPVSRFLPTEEQLATLATALADAVGPIAKILVKKAAKKAQSADELTAALSQEVDNGVDRKRFIVDANKILSSKSTR